MSKFRAMAAGLAVASFLTTAAGCGAANQMPRGTAPSGTLTRQGTNLSQLPKVNPNSIMPGTGYTTPVPGTRTRAPGYVSPTPGALRLQPTAFDTIKADKIMKNIGHINGARNIKAIVRGNTALVGYTPSGTMRNTLATKSAIVKKVKTLEKTVTNVVVSERTDVMHSINKLSTDIKNNKMGMNLNNTFNNLVNKAKGR